MQIRKFLPFQKKWKKTNEDLNISIMTNKPPFKTWEQMMDKMV